MAKRKYQGPSNDKSRSMQKLMEAVGRSINTYGYTRPIDTNIAKAAGLSRRLISLYFGTIDNLIETYVRGKDYWIAASGDAVDLIEKSTGENTRPIADQLLQNQLRYFFKE